MIYIETNSTDTYYNFGLEYYFTAEKKLDDTVFLFWRTTPTLMVGKYQNTLEEINREYAEKHGINIVRRMSGGGTIYTDMGGWQYTFIDYGDTEQVHFAEYISPVISALSDLGVKAEFNGRNDLLIDGKKISGNAQYKLKGNTVHHGSLLYRTDIEKMVCSTTVDDYKIISKSIKSVRDRVTNISEHIKIPISETEFKEKMINSIMRGSKRIYTPVQEDIKRIKELAEGFNSWESKYGANPKYSAEYTGRFKGGRVNCNLEIKRGHIIGINLSGDFFANEKADNIADVLTGCKYEYAEILSKVKESGIGDAIYGVTAEELTNLILGK